MDRVQVVSRVRALETIHGCLCRLLNSWSKSADLNFTPAAHRPALDSRNTGIFKACKSG